jgi:hypothetical protein
VSICREKVGAAIAAAGDDETTCTAMIPDELSKLFSRYSVRTPAAEAVGAMGTLVKRTTAVSDGKDTGSTFIPSVKAE